MAKKGKFKLLSYLIEDSLIYYKSFNKSEILFAFCIFKVSNLNQIISILNKFLNKGFFYYYSIQINIANRDIEVILCFRANEKNQIIELFGLASHKLIEYDNSIQILKKRNLEDKFINIFIKNFDSSIRIYKKPESILIKNHTYEKVLEFYEIKGYESQNQILIHLMNFIKNLKQKGYLILNFKIIDNQPALNTYFIRIRESPFINHVNFKEDVNNFFNLNLLNKSEINLAKVYRILWRLNLTEEFSPFNKVDTTLLIGNNSKIYSIPEFNLKFEELLKSNQIEYQRLNQNLLFIEQKIVFITLIKLNFKLILKIFKRFFSKYLIYLLILDENEYQKLLKVDKVRLLKDIVILNNKEFKNLNLKKFKN